MTDLSKADWGRIFAKAWLDPEFKTAFEADPRAAIARYADDLDIDAAADFIPPAPDGVTEQALKDMLAGDTTFDHMYCC
jgi:hypothetical protein